MLRLLTKDRLVNAVSLGSKLSWSRFTLIVRDVAEMWAAFGSKLGPIELIASGPARRNHLVG